MSEYTLDELRMTFPALDANERGDYAALRQANPSVDQLRAAREPSTLVVVDGGEVVVRPAPPRSPAARSHPTISAGLDRAQQIPSRYDVVGLRGLDRIVSNIGRRVLPFRAGGYTVDDLRAEERERLGITRWQQRQLDAEYEQLLDPVDYGGQPIGTVAFYCEEWTEADGALACPVPPGWSAQRIAGLVSLASCVCFWCARHEPTPLDDHLLISSGGFLRVFPTCSQCRDGFDRDTDYKGLHWLVRSDRWFVETGCPSDEWA